MSKPTSRLDFWPDPVTARAARVKWFGAGWHYTLDFGDGSDPVRVLFTDPPRRHVYPRAGTYTVIATSELDSRISASLPVTIREFTAPEVTATLLDDGRSVELAVPTVAEPVRWRVDWGDGTGMTEHGAGEVLVHTYDWDFGKPQITVVDVPSRRTARVTGPEIGPEPPPPEPVEYQGFCWEFVERVGSKRRVILHGGGLAPGEEITYYPYSQEYFQTITADTHGEVHEPLDIPVKNPARFDTWRSFGVATTSAGRVHVPYNGPSLEAGTPEITYHLAPEDTRTLTFSVSPVQRGQHVIDYGDGNHEVVEVEKVPMLAQHTYTGTGTHFTVTVTLPDGSEVQRQVVGSFPCPPCFTASYPGQCSVSWWITSNWCGACGQDGGEAFSPVEIDNKYHAPCQIHKPEDGSAWHVAFGFGGFVPGEYTFTYRTPLHPPAQHKVHIAKAGAVKRPPWVDVVQLVDTTRQFTAWFGVTEEWDGGYAGMFEVHNHGDAASTWQVEFTLADPAVLWEVRPTRTTSFTDLGGGRWRITSTQPVAEGRSAVVRVRIEPPGKTKKFPQDITARPAPDAPRAEPRPNNELIVEQEDSDGSA
ncbi:hypothetical protein IL38_24135 [Actinopolyspora erythraea]|uniref:PKD domain-containing protein n=1 Tax=Actinopolyspora erythraea TaxID=414996 RepID=A0ABR4WYI1_9ACTN|nr:hypothetical protein [Actinopolyspora erythraea]KGI79388.1 hypothetical protein IL38_24135 [Actinopolyspora erythraea]